MDMMVLITAELSLVTSTKCWQLTYLQTTERFKFVCHAYTCLYRTFRSCSHYMIMTWFLCWEIKGVVVEFEAEKKAAKLV